MATKVLYTQQFPAAPDVVWAMLTDVEYIRRKGEQSGSLEVNPDVELQAERTVVISRRKVPANVPGFLKRFVGDVLTLNETQAWDSAQTDGVRRGTFVIDFGGQPMAFSGSLLLRASTEGASVTTDGTLKASVPIVGRKAEAVAKEWAERYLRREEEVARLWLAGERG